MKNVWKGLIVGGLTGAGFGTLLDLMARGSDQAVVAGERARQYAPVVADRVRSAVAAGMAQVEEAGLPDRIVDAARRAADSDAADQAKDALGRTVHRGRGLVGSLHHSDAADNVRRGVARAATKGQRTAAAAAGAARH